ITSPPKTHNTPRPVRIHPRTRLPVIPCPLPAQLLLSRSPLANQPAAGAARPRTFPCGSLDLVGPGISPTHGGVPAQVGNVNHAITYRLAFGGLMDGQVPHKARFSAVRPTHCPRQLLELCIAGATRHRVGGVHRHADTVHREA